MGVRADHPGRGTAAVVPASSHERHRPSRGTGCMFPAMTSRPTGRPRVLEADTPEGSAADGWWFPAGGSRVSMAHGFMIGPDGEFGIDATHGAWA